jgi:hypothetical protein
MNRKFLTAWLVAFVVWMGGSFAVHGTLLAAKYATLPNLYRPMDTQTQFMPYLIGAHVMLAAAFVWIYSRGVTAAAWMGQGIRYGLAVGLLTTPTYLIYYSVQPLPRSLVAGQIIGDGVLIVVLGVVTAFMYKGAAKA